MCKSKNRYFYHIFVSPGDAPGAITLNVVSMEREFDSYKLSCSMCPFDYNRLWDRARYWSKIVIFSYPFLHSTPLLGGSRRNIGIPFGMGKLEWCRYPMVKKFWRYLCFGATPERDGQTDRQTDGQRVTAITALCIASHSKNDDDDGDRPGHWQHPAASWLLVPRPPEVLPDVSDPAPL